MLHERLGSGIDRATGIGEFACHRAQGHHMASAAGNEARQ